MDVGVPARPTCTERPARGGARRGRKAGPQPPLQEPLGAPLPQPPALPLTRDEAEKGTSRSAL